MVAPGELSSFDTRTVRCRVGRPVSSLVVASACSSSRRVARPESHEGVTRWRDRNRVCSFSVALGGRSWSCKKATHRCVEGSFGVESGGQLSSGCSSSPQAVARGLVRRVTRRKPIVIASSHREVTQHRLRLVTAFDSISSYRALARSSSHRSLVIASLKSRVAQTSCRRFRLLIAASKSSLLQQRARRCSRELIAAAESSSLDQRARRCCREIVAGSEGPDNSPLHRSPYLRVHRRSRELIAAAPEDSAL